jgi:predicted RND superfamily exporter protein
VLVALTAPDRLDGRALEAVQTVSDLVAEMVGVRSVHSVTRGSQIVAGRIGADTMPLVGPPLGEERAVLELNAALDRNPELTGVLISRDRRTAMVIAELEDRAEDDAFRGNLVDAVRALRGDRRLAGLELRVTGLAVQKYDVARLVTRDQQILIPLAVVVLALLLALHFRRVAAVVLPLVVTGTSLVWTVGVYSLAGLPLNTITSLLPPVVMVLSVATSVHLYHGWLETPATAPGGAGDRFERAAAVVRELWTPCAFTALTTVLGLLSLAISDTPAVRQFGVFAAFGVVASFVVAMILIPAALTFLPEDAGDGVRRPGGVVDRLLRATATVASARPWSVLLSATALTLVALALLPGVRTDTDLVGFLRPGAELRTDTEYMDGAVGGVASLEIAVARRDRYPLTAKEDVERMAAFASKARRHDGVSGVLSIVPVVEQLTAAEYGGEPRLPESSDDLAYVFELVAEGRDALIRRLVVEDLTRVRLSVRVHRIGSARAARLIEEVGADARDVFGDGYDVVTTGSFYHVALDSNRIVRNQVAMFGVALLVVVTAIGVVFRSWRIAALAIAPNVFPIVWTGAVMSLAGIELSTGTAMIASVMIGLAVDDTIHYLARYRREYEGDAVDAVRRTSTGVGRALTVTTAVLVFGFWVGAAGSFLPTVYFSLLSGATMIGALSCDLLVLPAALVLGDRSGLLRF